MERVISSVARGVYGVPAAVSLAVLASCASAVPSVGPSPVTTSTPEAVSMPAAAGARPLPVGLDPAYVRALAVISPDGLPKRWEGGPFRHCFGPEINAAVVASFAAEMTDITGIQRTDSGLCNVTWSIDPQLPTSIDGRSELSGTATAIYSARIVFHTTYGVSAKGRHEAGHVLGLDHSPRASDCMALFNRDGSAFSADELAVLAWIYER